MALPAGFGVLVTRPAKQAEALCRLIEEAGGKAIRLPLLEIVPASADEPGPRRLGNLDGLDWLVFVSANAVRCAFDLLGPCWLEPGAVKIAAIGLSTAKALAERGVEVDLKPKQQFNSEALLAEPAFLDVSGRRFLIVRGVGGRETLAETLRTRGGWVEYAEVYRRLQPNVNLSSLLERWRAGGVGAVTVTSGEALSHLSQLMAGEGLELLRQTPVVTIGERLAQQAHAAGCRHVVAADPSDADIFNAVARVARSLVKHTPTLGRG